MGRQRASAFPSKGRGTQMIPKPTMLMKRWQAGFDRHRHLQLADGSRIDVAYGIAQQPNLSPFHPVARSKVASSLESRIGPSSGATRGNANFFEASLSAHLAQPRPGFHPIKRSSRSLYQGFSSLPSDCEAKAEEAAARLTGKLPWLEEEPLPLLSSQTDRYRHRGEDTTIAHRQPPLLRRSSSGVLPLADAFSDDEGMHVGLAPRYGTSPPQHCRESMIDAGIQHSQLGLDDHEDLTSRTHPGVLPAGCLRERSRASSDCELDPRGNHTSTRYWRHSFAETLGRRRPDYGRESPPQPEGWSNQQHEAVGRRFDEPMADSRQRLRFPDDESYYDHRSMIAPRSTAHDFHTIQMQSRRQMRSASPPRVGRVPRRLAVAPSGGIQQCIAENDPSNWSSEDDMPRQSRPMKRMRREAHSPQRVATRERRLSPPQRNQDWQQGCIFDDNPFKRNSNATSRHARHQGVFTPAATHKPQSLLALGLSPAWEE